MSAFVVSSEHIALLLDAGLSLKRHGGVLHWYTDVRTPEGDLASLEAHELRWDNAREVGQMLLDECIRSVSHRYPDDDLQDLPRDADYREPFSYRQRGERPHPVAVLKAIRSYEYQSCEHPEWEASEAKQFCECLAAHMIASLPGYDDAPTWSVTSRQVASAWRPNASAGEVVVGK